MWPWGHLGVAYLLYSLYTHRRFDRPPRAVPALALVIGSQFPDLIDKPLAWNFDVLPGGRTLSHSLVFAIGLTVVVYALANRFGGLETAIAFVIGHVVHLCTDVPPAVFGGDVSGLAYLLWPFVEQPPEEPVAGLLDAILTYYAVGPYELAQFVLFAFAAVVWYYDNKPGLAYVRSVLSRLQVEDPYA
ncbi:metal-dependent hydrolase [Halostagnicola larsenii XH-48]|uniref:Metal-dependent hydrolase n=1 Tax=Halostagnicola larsenii XH-48 TaxID=797299 RepID=W0JJD0_9EURY|nr:metal-dependent hydrolase [Halostagnicola larsenii]AHF98830.1 metal-dependent hydrolase [Halostagnicola larsenii XH-48]